MNLISLLPFLHLVAIQILTMEDIMQDYDYEYYQAHAKDAILEDITSDEDNAGILAMVRDNDPAFTNLAIVTESADYFDFVVREGDHLGWLGYFVGRNDKLETLYIDIDIDNIQNISLNTFFEGLGQNRSIEDLNISKDLGESFKGLLPFLRNNDSLRHLRFDFFDIRLQCAHNVALLLTQQSSLKGLTFDEVIFDHEGFIQIAAAFKSQPQMEELRLNGNCVGRNGYVALGNALEGCLSLRKLELKAYDNDIDDGRLIDDAGLHALVEGLKHCHKLVSLDLYGKLMITEEGSRSLSTLFQSDNCRLEHLDLARMNIDDGGMAVLAAGLASLPSLKRLNLRGTSIDDRGLQYLVRGLVNCNVEELDLSGNILIDSVSGMRMLGTLVRRTTNMRSLCLYNSSITDEGLQSFVEGVANCCSLTKLYLSYNNSITSNGLASLSSLLRAEHCSLSNLSLYDMHLGDDGATILANGLIGNNSLTKLELSPTDSGITARGWAAFSRLLCDTSSVNNTYLSNHTLQQIGGYGMPDTPSDIVQYLKLNESVKRSTVIHKILRNHPDIDVTPLFEFNLKCLPLVVEWLEKAFLHRFQFKLNVSPAVFERRNLSALFKFIRGMPLLAVNGYRSQKMKDVQGQSKSKKRTIDQI